jgi:hypothetical protein
MTQIVTKSIYGRVFSRNPADKTTCDILNRLYTMAPKFLHAERDGLWWIGTVVARTEGSVASKGIDGSPPGHWVMADDADGFRLIKADGHHVGLVAAFCKGLPDEILHHRDLQPLGHWLLRSAG